jgi:cytochrome c-type biogenesis protein CcmH
MLGYSERRKRVIESGLGIFLVLIVTGGVLWPLRERLWLCGITGVIVLSVLIFGYGYIGGFSAWRQHEMKVQREIAAVRYLQTIRDPNELIEKLRARLAQTPNSARGFFLLGRLYAGQGRWSEAVRAFKRAHQLAPQKVQITIQYAESLWRVNEGRGNAEIRALLQSVLTDHPDAPEALALLGRDAFEQKKYQQAVVYWRRLLQQVDLTSEAGIEIQRAIDNALVH